jgi:hypothetical protein
VRIRLSLVRSLVERGGSRRGRASVEPAVEPESQPEPVPAPEPQQKPEPGRVLAAVPSPPPQREPDPEPEAESAVVPLVLHDTTPRTWNLWELERLAAKMKGDSATEERTLLLVSLRQFANASGDLPVEFDSLVRDAFGADLSGVVR